MSEYDWEPVRGLPGHLPAGESILWQGAPDWKVLLRSAFHGRLVAAYFAFLVFAGFMSGSPMGAAVTVGVGLLGLGVLALLAWATARSTVYTLTTRRVVLRIGVALPKCFNLPLKLVEAADLKPLGNGHGDIALTMSGQRIGFLFLWPHVRPWKIKQPRPMLRAVPEAEQVAAKLTRACAALVAIDVAEPVETRTPVPAMQPVGVAA